MSPQLQPVPAAAAEEHQFHDWLHALAPRTWVSYGLIALNVAVWAWMVARGVDAFHPPAELLLQWGGNAASEVQRGQVWRLLTATFVHSGIVHLVMNMLGLWAIGQTAERIYGHRVFLGIYLGSALAASALSLHFSAQKTVSVGASGAVFGLAGVVLVAVLRHRDTMPRLFGKQMLRGIGFFVVYSLAQGFLQAGVDNAAHVGGLLAGALMGCILPVRPDLLRARPQARGRAVLALAAVAALVVGLAALAPPAAVDFQRKYAGAAAFELAMRNFNAAMLRLGQESQLLRAGKLSAQQSDERSRSVHAPAFRQVQAELAAVWLPPGDPRNALLQEVRQQAGWMAEVQGMASVTPPGSSQPQPADPARMAALQAAIQASSQRLALLIRTQNGPQNRPERGPEPPAKSTRPGIQ
ncbi:rhomboid family intramembrane serine protease [Rhodoferax sp.]|uniref:rhomboid family intramembrane serine protease n=1 Tax=Rhodoferax sp. TaxID=50421 RepID=UPI0025FD692A|nr:rhomboid family intramembrane serine protease [Rhodoferax sp.]